MADNIILSIEEPEIFAGPTEAEKQLCIQLEELIPDDAVCISVKENLDEDYDLSGNSQEPPPASYAVKKYLDDNGVKILAQTVGIHVKGRKQIPHIHYHFITEPFTPPPNASQHRQRWAAKQDPVFAFDLKRCSFKYQQTIKNRPKYQFLTYALKEGLHPIKFYSKFQRMSDKPMPRLLFNFLMETGKAIYETHCALVLRQEKTAERKQLALSELYEIVREKKFTTFREMMLWLEDNYIAKLSLEEKPDPKNYKTNCQKIGSILGIWKYCDF